MAIKMKNIQRLFYIISCCAVVASCSINKQISRQANTILLKDTAIRHGHIGISIYEPATGKYWYNYNAEKYFVPASNTKLFSLYAGMKYLGDSLLAAEYKEENDVLYLVGAGDPSFLHPDFSNHPLYNFLKQQANNRVLLMDNQTKSSRFKPLGRGWAWDDFNSDYMVERSFFPIYGNLASFTLRDNSVTVSPPFFKNTLVQGSNSLTSIDVERKKENNGFIVSQRGTANKKTSVPFKTGIDANDLQALEGKLLADTLKQQPVETGTIKLENRQGYKQIYSQPVDSLFKPMMHRSDNFFAEQTLLMASYRHLGYLSDSEMIENILNTNLKDLPQRPKWVDGSGLSRYNLFTPQDFVFILQKLKDDFGWDRMKNILPTGGEGTISSYYKDEAGFIYAKTGTLSNNCALSGYLVTRKGKLLLFSVLANNYQTSATPVRRAVEQFLKGIRAAY
jgi:serine-type D-Ala-D-Ala carboxypeptidase/endopeptidase (penicillin-binding protein 4)